MHASLAAFATPWLDGEEYIAHDATDGGRFDAGVIRI